MVGVHEKERILKREVEQAVAAGAPDVEVLAVELSGPGRFCVYIDHPGGVDHALCGRVTDLLRRYLDRYTVDVSSPGVERPVRTRAHFAAAAGRRVAVRTSEEIAGRKRFRGEVVEAGEQVVALDTGAERVDIPYGVIARGNLIDVDGRA